MPNPSVACSVTECAHHMSNNQCMAASVNIYNNEASSNSQTADDTQCKSFHPKNDMGDVVSSLGNTNVTGSIQAAFDSKQKLNPSVQCFVNSCSYWDNGNQCSAGSIQVSGQNPSSACETDCKTYVGK